MLPGHIVEWLESTQQTPSSLKMGVNFDVFIVAAGTFCPPSPALEIWTVPEVGCKTFECRSKTKTDNLYVTYCNFFLLGIASLRAAIALAGKGHKVRVLGRHPRRQSLGSVIGITLSSARVLGQYGVLEDVWRVCGDRRMTTNFRRWEDGSVLLSQEPAVRESPFGIW
jgi:hypothetical protein